MSVYSYTVKSLPYHNADDLKTQFIFYKSCSKISSSMRNDKNIISENLHNKPSADHQVHNSCTYSFVFMECYDFIFVLVFI